MNDMNVAAVCGTVTSEPKQRELPSGSVVTNVEVTTRLDDDTHSVPIVVVDAPVTVRAGDQVVAVGRIVRRFFRAGGVTQSRTELVATKLVRASNKRTVERALQRAAAELAG